MSTARARKKAAKKEEALRAALTVEIRAEIVAELASHKKRGMLLIWPEVFSNPDEVSYADGELGLTSAISDGLTGWAVCMAGAKENGGVPLNFGVGMQKLGKRLDISPTKEEFDRKYDEWDMKRKNK